MSTSFKVIFKFVTTTRSLFLCIFLKFQEIKSASSKSKIQDVVAIRHSLSNSDQSRTTVILLCEDGSLKIYMGSQEQTGFWMSPAFQPTRLARYTSVVALVCFLVLTPALEILFFSTLFRFRKIKQWCRKQGDRGGLGPLTFYLVDPQYRSVPLKNRCGNTTQRLF